MFSNVFNDDGVERSVNVGSRVNGTDSQPHGSYSQFSKLMPLPINSLFFCSLYLSSSYLPPLKKKKKKI